MIDLEVKCVLIDVRPGYKSDYGIVTYYTTLLLKAVYYQMGGVDGVDGVTPKLF